MANFKKQSYRLCGISKKKIGTYVLIGCFSRRYFFHTVRALFLWFNCMQCIWAIGLGYEYVYPMLGSGNSCQAHIYARLIWQPLFDISVHVLPRHSNSVTQQNELCLVDNRINVPLRVGMWYL